MFFSIEPFAVISHIISLYQGLHKRKSVWGLAFCASGKSLPIAADVSLFPFSLFLFSPFIQAR